jgi:ATP-dependent Clp protease protease subunit
MARPKTDTENYINTGIDEKNRIIYFGVNLSDLSSEEDAGEFSKKSCEKTIRAILKMQSEHPKTPIEIHMNSCGGDTLAMLHLYDVIQASSCKFIFYGGGEICSSATWVLAGCDERYLYPNTEILIHNASSSFSGKTGEIKIEAERLIQMQEVLDDLYTRNSRMPKAFWKSIGDKEVYLSAEEAVQLGLADKIVHPKKRGNYRKSREFHLSQEVNKTAMKRLVNRLYKRIGLDPIKDLKIESSKPEPVDENLKVEPMKVEENDGKE